MGHLGISVLDFLTSQQAIEPLLLVIKLGHGLDKKNQTCNCWVLSKHRKSTPGKKSYSMLQLFFLPAYQ